MKYNLLVSRKILLFISILGFIVLLAGAVFKISHWIFVGLTGNILIAIGLFLTLFAWFFVLIDVIRNKPQNWILWIVFLFVFGNITSMIYLIFRKS